MMSKAQIMLLQVILLAGEFVQASNSCDSKHNCNGCQGGKCTFCNSGWAINDQGYCQSSTNPANCIEWDATGKTCTACKFPMVLAKNNTCTANCKNAVTITQHVTGNSCVSMTAASGSTSNILTFNTHYCESKSIKCVRCRNAIPMNNDTGATAAQYGLMNMLQATETSSADGCTHLTPQYAVDKCLYYNEN